MTRTVRCTICKGVGRIYTRRAFGVEIRDCRPCAGSGMLSVVFARKIESEAALG